MTAEHQEPVARDGDTPGSADQNADQAGQATGHPPGDDQGSPGPADIDSLQKALVEAREQVLRYQAEMQNLRRRVERDIESARKFALDKFVEDLLPVADNLERASATLDPQQRAGNEHLNSLGEGVDLTLRGFLDAIGRHKVVALNPVGEPFDPAFHQAVATVPRADLPANRVVEVFQKGYTLNGRLVRPAMVVVSKSGNDG
ncbi:MAG: nucleotide exchange factor GrpE [Porticoccaceae bacterium]